MTEEVNGSGRKHPWHNRDIVTEFDWRDREKPV
jgi:hypothetical protein